jgi:inhibitor of KinA sporulation pathway (predicted exonuclease)
MNFIIYDLEATCWEGRPPKMVQETIEIGAVKTNEYGEVLGQFNRFVRPVINPNLSFFCRKLTSIDQVTVNRAAQFAEVIEDFQEWVGIYDDEEHLLCSWGNFDKTQLIRDAELHDLEFDWIEDFHINLKKQYHEIKRWRNYKGLKRVVEHEGFEFTGIYHRAISDAQNLAKVFVKYVDEWRY